MFKCTLGHKQGNLDSRAQTGLVITLKKGLISFSFLLVFFFCTDTHSPATPKRMKSKPSQPRQTQSHRSKKGTAATHLPAHGVGWRRAREAAARPSKLPELLSCCLPVCDHLQGCHLRQHLWNDAPPSPQFTRKHLQASFTLLHQENYLLHRGIP